MTECKRTVHGENQCHYSFLAGDGHYTGSSSVSSDTGFGQIVVVYYDSKDPTWNALEDLSAKGREDEDWACIFLLLIATFSAFLFYAKTLSPSRKGTP